MTNSHARPSIRTRVKGRILKHSPLSFAALFAATIAMPLAAQERLQIDLPLFPVVTNYAASCAAETPLQLDRYDLENWRGENLDIAPEQLINLALLYARGNGNTRPNAELAQRILTYVSESQTPLQARAKYLAAVQILNMKGSLEMDTRAAALLMQAANVRITGAARELAFLYETGRGVPLDYELAAKYYRASGASGDAESAFALARLYGEHLAKAPNPEAAVNMAKLGIITLLNDVNQGQCSSLIAVARLYETGDIIAPNESAASAWYEAAASTGSPRAMAVIAQRYYTGVGVEPSVTLALDWWRRAAELGSLEAKANIGLLYANGDGVEASALDAVRWLSEAAEGGNLKAMQHLVSLYNGKLKAIPLTERDAERAYYWTDRLYQSDKTRVSFIMNLARALSTGDGTSVDANRAFLLFDQAMRLGNRSALRQMAQAYINGDGVERAPLRGLQIAKRAAARGDLSAYKLIIDIYRCGNGVENNAPMADLWTERAASLGDLDSLLTLSNRRVDELSLKEKERSLQLLLRAAANDNREAMVRLSIIYRSGAGVDVDIANADRWEALAIRPGEGQAAAFYFLAEAYRISESYPFNPVRVEQLLSDSHKLNYIRATVRLGKYYVRPGNDGMNNVEEGVRLLRLAANQGSADAMRELAIYFRSIGNITEAIGWLNAATEAGLTTAKVLQAEWAYQGILTGQPEPELALQIIDEVIALNECSVSVSAALTSAIARGYIGNERQPEALTWAREAIDNFRPNADEVAQLALAVLKGQPAPEFNAYGIELLERSMALGSPRGHLELAKIYLNGSGAPADFNKAMELLDLAVERGEPNALLYIGRAKIQGLSGTPDYDGAWSAMESAAAAGIPEAYREMGQWYLRGLGRPENVEEGVRLLEQASQMGDVAAMLDLANIYAVGFIVDPRPDIAVRWLESASRMGNTEAMHRLGLAYLLGLGVEQNDTEAKRWFRLSGSEGYSLGASETQ